MSAWAPVRAQVIAEVRTRLRSPATLVAFLALFALTFLWIPDPATNVVAIAWEGAGGTVTGVYDSAFLGACSAVLAALFLPPVGFYLVAGSVRRDRERGVGAILAATPLSKAAYLGGKLAAHAVYLSTLGLLALATGLLAFLRHGNGPLDPFDFLAPFVLLTVPGLVFVASLAVLFDVAPGLRGRGGLVLFFFVWTFVLLLVPVAMHGGLGERVPVEGPAVFDPLGFATIIQLIGQSVGGDMRGLSIGLQFFEKPIPRVAWPGTDWTAAVVGSRLAALAWAAVPFGLSVLLFDRFDPARRRAPGGRRRRAERAARGEALPEARRAEAGAGGAPFGAGRPSGPGGDAGAATGEPAGAVRGVGFGSLPPIEARPSAARAVLAEARLLWSAGGALRWLLPLAALAAALPGDPGRAGTAALLLLVAPVVAEAAARERLAGTGPLVFSQPGVPSSPVLWKLAAAALLLVALGLPRLLATGVAAPGRALGLLLGLGFVAAFSTGAGALSRGGKLFLGLYVALWYGAVNGTPDLDFAAAFGPEAGVGVSAAYFAAGAGLLVLARLVEQARGRVG